MNVAEGVMMMMRMMMLEMDVVHEDELMMI
jgi:hypothetical protein